MTLEDLVDLIRANSANTNGRIDGLRGESNAALMNIRNDLTGVGGDIRDIRRDLSEVRRNLDLASTVAAMRREIDALFAEVAELKRRAS
jgi:hypothetical protein